MIWFPYAILNFIVMVFCYLTNWFVCLFADECGELPHIFRMWQTWDDSTDCGFLVKTVVPKFLRYDFDRHYEEYESTTPDLEKVGRKRWFVRLKDPNFTTKEKIQRYFCRVWWLTRNCSYGFAFWCFGFIVEPQNMVWIKYTDDYRLGYDKSRNILIRPWVLKSNRRINKYMIWEVFLGWKISNEHDTPMQCMIATRPTIRFE